MHHDLLGQERYFTFISYPQNADSLNLIGFESNTLSIIFELIPTSVFFSCNSRCCCSMYNLSIGGYNPRGCPFDVGIVQTTNKK
jgi:hypothetical protein